MPLAVFIPVWMTVLETIKPPNSSLIEQKEPCIRCCPSVSSDCCCPRPWCVWWTRPWTVSHADLCPVTVSVALSSCVTLVFGCALSARVGSQCRTFGPTRWFKCRVKDSSVSRQQRPSVLGGGRVQLLRHAVKRRPGPVSGGCQRGHVRSWSQKHLQENYFSKHKSKTHSFNQHLWDRLLGVFLATYSLCAICGAVIYFHKCCDFPQESVFFYWNCL